MEVRQLLTVAIFMLAAVVMKTAVPGSLQAHEEVNSLKSASESTSYHQAVALAPVNIFQNIGNTQLQVPADTAASSSEAGVREPMKIPGSLIALVVAALSLVSVARRTTAG